jgi:hypothetical protein
VPYVVGPFSDAELGGFEPPAGHVGAALDLSPDVSAFLHQDAVPRDWRPIGLFYFPDVQQAQRLGRDTSYRVVSGGGDTLDAASRDLLGRLAGYTPATSETAAEVLSRAVDDLAIGDDSAIDRQKVFGPTGGNLVIRVGNRAIIDRPISQHHRTEWQRCKRLDLLTAARRGGNSLSAACREVGYLLRQWSDSVESDWISAEAASVGLVPAVPATTYSDDFNRTSLGGSWSSVLNSFTCRTDNGGECSDSSGGSGQANSAFARYDSDVSSSDHTVTAEVAIANGVQSIGGTAARFSASALTCYFGYVQSYASQNDYRWVSKEVAGTITSLYSTQSSGFATGITADHVLDVSGSDITANWNGTEYASVSDSSISSGTRGGIYSWWHTSRPWHRSFEITDGVGPTFNPFLAAACRTTYRGPLC